MRSASKLAGPKRQQAAALQNPVSYAMPVNEYDRAGLGDGLAVQAQAALVYQVVDDGDCGIGGIGVAVGQRVIQFHRRMPLEKRRAGILRRTHTPVAMLSARFPNVQLQVFDNVFSSDGHGCRLPLEVWTCSLPLVAAMGGRCSERLMTSRNSREPRNRRSALPESRIRNPSGRAA